MTLGATLYVFKVNLSDSDRGLYESLEIRAAQHPSESESFLLTRVLAYCLEYREGIAFAGGGVSDRDEPTLFARDLTGAYTLWVELGIPAAERLHQASKASPQVLVYCHKDPRQLERLKEEAIHRADSIEVVVIDPGFLQALVSRLERRLTLDITVAGGHLYCSLGSESFDMSLQRLPLQAES